MSDRTDAFEADRWVIMIMAVTSAILIWRSAFDPFSLPKATAVVLGATVLVALALRRWIVTGLISVPVSPLAVAAGAFLLALLVATVTSDDLATSLSGHYKRYTGFFLYAGCVVVLLAILRSFSAASVTRVVAAQFVAGALVITYGLMQWVGVEPYNWQNLYGDAVFSFLGNPNFAGAYAGITMGLALWAATNTAWASWARGVGIAAALGSVLVAVASDSFQGPVTVATATAVFLLGWLIHRGGSALRVGVPALLGASAVVGALMIAGFAGSGPLQRLNEQNTLQLRGYYWGAALNMFTDNPLVGVGLDRYGAYYRSARTQEAALNSVFSVSADAPHNVPLDMFAEGGLLLGGSYLAFVAITAWFIVTGLRKLRGPRLLLLAGIAGSWTAYQLQSLVSIDVAPLAVVQWVLAAAIAVVVREPALREIRLPWAPAPALAKKRGKVSRSSHSRVSSGREAIGYSVAGVVLLVGVIIFLRPLRADSQYQDSRVASGGNDRQEAFAAAERSTEIASWEPTYWFQSGVRHLEAGQEREAAELFAEAIERDPRGLEQVVSGARVAQSQGNTEKAQELYEQALRIEPYAPEMVLEVARFSLAAGLVEDAVEHARYLVEVRPENDEFWMLLAEAYLADDRTGDAIDAYRRALRINPSNEAAQDRLESLEE